MNLKSVREEVLGVGVGFAMKKSSRNLATTCAVIPLGIVGLVTSCNSPADTRPSTATYQAAKTDVSTMASACQAFADLNGGRYPDSLQILVVPDVNGQSFLNASKLPRDPWGREYLYERAAKSGEQPRIWTYGRDGVPGGGAEDADVGNWMLR